MDIVKRALHVFCLIAGISTCRLLAHEVLTHQNIGNVAVAYLQQSPQYQNRPLLQDLQQLLLIGAVQEDQAALPNGFGGAVGNSYRYFFHFNPPLSFGVFASANCSSLDWGLEDAQCTATCRFPVACSVLGSTTSINNYRWDQNLAPDHVTGAPTTASIEGLSYVVHLLEDLGSPPHTRNDLHACPIGDQGLIYCDPFERDNNGGTPSLAVTLALPIGANAIIPTIGFTTPEQFFQSLQSYVSNNYYSNNTIFEPGLPGPCPVTGCALSDDQYFYGPCITASGPVDDTSGVSAGTCHSLLIGGQLHAVRRIAHKGPWYWALCSIGICNPSNAEIDSVVAQEQFAELGPVIAQHVAAFIQFYAPVLTVQINGPGSLNVTSGAASANCVSTPVFRRVTAATCPYIFPQNTVVTISAPFGSVVDWSGDCAASSMDASTEVTLVVDKACTVVFHTTCVPCAVAVASVSCTTSFFDGTFPAFTFSANGTAEVPASGGSLGVGYNLLVPSDTIGLGSSVSVGCGGWSGTDLNCSAGPTTSGVNTTTWTLNGQYIYFPKPSGPFPVTFSAAPSVNVGSDVVNASTMAVLCQ